MLASITSAPQTVDVRVLFLNSARGLGGGLTSAFDVATGLADAGHHVTMACHPESELLLRVRSDSRIEAVPIAIRAELNLARILQLRRLIHGSRPAVILADKRKDTKFAFLARAGDPTPAIVHRHGAPSPLRRGTFYRFVWTRLQALIVNSHAMKQELLRRTPWVSRLPIHVIHNGKDLTRYRPRPELRAAMRASLGIPDDAYVACFHGAFVERKQIRDLLRAAAALTGQLDVHVLLVGRGPGEPDLRQIARESGIGATFAGMRTDIPEVLSAADVYVHLSTAEGFSNSVVEALACGLPVVASAAHSHPEQVEDGVTGRLVPVGDLAALRLALLEWGDERRRQEGRAAARRRAEQAFGRERMARAYADVLEAAADLTGRPVR